MQIPLSFMNRGLYLTLVPTADKFIDFSELSLLLALTDHANSKAYKAFAESNMLLLDNKN